MRTPEYDPILGLPPKVRIAKWDYCPVCRAKVGLNVFKLFNHLKNDHTLEEIQETIDQLISLGIVYPRPWLMLLTLEILDAVVKEKQDVTSTNRTCE